MAAAQAVPTFIASAHPEAAAISGAELGGTAGLLLGAIAGIWLVFREKGRWAGSALTWLWVCALLLVGCLGFVAFS